ncbi:MAG: efflux RND transporter periplasmic adaptor subunit, partial [Cytophagales bacterium]|nr:efflux RND transporter periplasmic adaptor subunit [Cytophagales bacterium]
SSEKELITAKNELQKAESEFERIQKILKIYGEGNQNSIYAVKAPIAGFIVEKNITENTQFRADNSGNIFTISNLDNLWAIANVYESNIANIKLGQDAIVTTMAYPNKHYEGKVDKIFNVLDAETRVEKIKIKMNNYDNILKPEMFAYVMVRYPEGIKMIQIPSQAIIFSNNKNYVVVYKGPCEVETREVTVYKNIKGYSFIASGLAEGEMVISNSQLIIFNTLNN